jgi:predicted RNA-binding protein Jag
MEATDNRVATAEAAAPADSAGTTGAAEPMATSSEATDSPGAGAAPEVDAALEAGGSDDDASPALPLTAAEETIDSAALARDLLDQILQAMAVPATVNAEGQPDGSVRLLVEGPDMGVVIGKHGGTINALQYLVSLILQKRVGERIRLVIDAEGYRTRREQALRDMALAYAQRVKETGQEAVLDALQSYERRIVHNSLSDDPDVFTYSEGEEPDRRVVISPRDT